MDAPENKLKSIDKINKNIRQNKILSCNISNSTLYNYISSKNFLNLSFKKIHKKLLPTDVYSKQSYRKSLSLFVERITHCFDQEYDLIYIDEAGLKFDLQKRKGFEKKKKRLHIHKIHKSSKKYSGIFAMTRRGILDFQVVEGGVTRFCFYGFLITLIRKYELGNKKCAFILDNAPLHHSRDFKSKFQMYSNLIFVPIYSPWANPIENYFGILKNKLRGFDLFNIFQLIRRIYEINRELSTVLFEKLELKMLRVVRDVYIGGEPVE